MSDKTSGLQLTEVFTQLNEIPLHYSNLDDALRGIAELGKTVMNSHTFALALVDADTKEVTNVVCKSNNSELEELINNQKKLWNEVVLSKREICYLLLTDKYQLKAVYSYPLWSAESIVVGHAYHFSAVNEAVSKQEEGLMKSFASRAIVAIENLNNPNFDISQTFTTLSELSQALLANPSDEFIEALPQKACEFFSVPTCVLWKINKKHRKFVISDASVGVDDDYKKLELSNNFDAIQQHYNREGIFYLPDTAKASAKFLYPEEVRARGWVSMLSVPLRVEGEIIGILDIFTKNSRYFTEVEKEQFMTFSTLAALSFEKDDANQKEADNFRDKEKLLKLTEIMLRMLECRDVHDILEALSDGALELVYMKNRAISMWSELIVEISRLDYYTGELKIIVEQNQSQNTNEPLKLDEGITGLALKEMKTINVEDLSNSEYQNIYVNYWENTKSQIAIPIFIDKIPAIEGSKVKKIGSKRIGILNIESPDVNTFSEADAKYLSLLAKYAAVLIERRDSDEKTTKLRIIEREIASYRNHKQIMEEVIKGIIEILDFEVVNISLVDFETKRIKTEYVGGIPEDEIEEFKKDADHALDSGDIQASIVKNKQIEVPSIDDPRFDKSAYAKYAHNNLIRVFIPIIEPLKDRVIGTVEAGYNRQYRDYIYERDVLTLQSFVGYVVRALAQNSEQKKSEMIDKITHEFRSPIVGIRSHASFVQRRLQELPDWLIDQKLEDILTDCETLLIQVAEIEYLMGGSRASQRSKIEKTLIFRDVIYKIIKQLSPIVIEQGFSIEDIDYSNISPQTRNLMVKIDKMKLNQVVYNLLVNSIKYAKNDPNKFKIVIDINDSPKKLIIIKFKDWGIGIQEKYQKEIFQEGFRCPEAIQTNVAGSGLGLAISKSIMKELGGDLILSNNANPTEFHLIIPRQQS